MNKSRLRVSYFNKAQVSAENHSAVTGYITRASNGEICLQLHKNGSLTSTWVPASVAREMAAALTAQCDASDREQVAS